MGGLRRPEAGPGQAPRLALSTPEVVERVATGRGELVLRRDGEHFEVISNGTFLMDTRNGESERALVTRALDDAPAPAKVLIGGLGVGFSLVAALQDGRACAVTVVEIEPTILAWHRTHLGPFSRGALDDPRVQVVTADLVAYLAGSSDTFDAICLDIDNGPDWTVTAANTSLYGEAGTALLAARLRPGGALSVWSASETARYETALRDRFSDVRSYEIPVPRGQPDVVVVGTGVRGVRNGHGTRNHS